MTAVDELCVEAAISGKRDDVLAAMLADPLASKIDYDEMVRMTDELLGRDQALAPAVRVGSRRTRRQEIVCCRDSRRFAVSASARRLATLA